MRFFFDHVVHYVESPENAIEVFKKKGMHAVKGGEHANGQTFNTLSYFDLSYIEFLGILEKKPFLSTKHPKNSLLQTIVNDQFSEGLSRFVLRTDDIDSAAQYLRDKGVEVNGPLYRNRKRPDGSLLEWYILLIEDKDNQLELPYIIQWNDSDELIREELIRKGIINHHPSGATFSNLSFAVKDIERIVKRWSDLFELIPSKEYIDYRLQAKCRLLNLQGGNLIFCSPIDEGIVSNVLKKRGEKPFEINFKSEKKSDQFELFKGFYRINKI